ncbi:MAG: Mth938-like domain-containing protein [Candidatus Neomarinimicrobiota bacterium]
MIIPRIVRFVWGKVIVEGFDPFRDVMLFPGGARVWDWRETGTSHSPGIQPADVQELLEHGAQVVILSTGMLGRLGVCPETRVLLQQKGIEMHIIRTKKAVRLYNQLCADKPVGALIHSTC